MNRIEVSCGLNGGDFALKIDGHDIRYVRDVSISVPLGGTPTVTIEVLGRIDAKIRGAVNIIETVHYDSEGKEIKIGEKTT